MRKVASIRNSVDSGELMRDSSVFYVKKKHKNNVTSNRRKRKNKIAKGGNSETLGQRCSTEVVFLKVDLDQDK